MNAKRLRSGRWQLLDKKNNLFIVMRGLPGSGKSTLADLIRRETEQLGLSCEVFSTDEYFYQNGKYVFDGAMLQHAHEWNKRRTFDAMRDGIHVIVLDNTNIMRQHFADYVKFAEQSGYDVREEVVGSFDYESVNRCHSRNIHGVTLATIQRMASAFQK